MLSVRLHASQTEFDRRVFDRSNTGSMLGLLMCLLLFGIVRDVAAANKSKALDAVRA